MVTVEDGNVDVALEPGGRTTFGSAFNCIAESVAATLGIGVSLFVRLGVTARSSSASFSLTCIWTSSLSEEAKGSRLSSDPLTLSSMSLRASDEWDDTSFSSGMLSTSGLDAAFFRDVRDGRGDPLTRLLRFCKKHKREYTFSCTF